MDIGGVDNTAILFGYYEFPKARLVVQREWVKNTPDVTSSMIAETVKAVEKDLWGEKQPFIRIADNNNKILLHDLAYTNELIFQSISKDSLHAMVNKVREWVKNGRLIIHPECEQLIGCLNTGIWDLSRKKFDRSSLYGHFDALAALVYMIRIVDEYSNPIPAHFGKSEETHWIPPKDKFDPGTNKTRQTLKKWVKGT